MRHFLSAFLVIAALSACQSSVASPPTKEAAPVVEAFEDWYPSDITPPPGTQYHCALKALPRELPGIAAGDKRFVNHVFALLLQATQERLKIHGWLSTVAPRGVEDSYATAIQGVEERIKEEPVPKGLETFHGNVLKALALQKAFYFRALAMHREGRKWDEITLLPEGHDASRLLVGAWDVVKARYPGWPSVTSDSVYHHLCALDIY